MNKILVIGIRLFFSCLLLQCEELMQKNIVGDEKRWSPDANLTQWTEGKKFKAGDVLVFKYNRDPFLMVAAVRDKYLFEKCDLYVGAINLYRSGNDHVVLEKGTTYFAPYLTTYCENGMKLTIDVE
ncbi:basic blue protein-like [Pyrus ussuriensis x Pyrus communis]|uniref:Basic blue protein-like n=1 Tax=Pyrus ussuriensis x Pyrus communis TaxID=2448454 RepID=A0A5N5HPJ4_9ROSA|nr:basic blue protein-like [Pyrus ussuriensis x Pyrus communis]